MNALDHSVFDTEYTADCFETVPASACNETLVTVGTYQYFPEESIRRGRLYLMSLYQDLSLKEQQRIDMEGILDMRWTGNILTCAMSNGSLQKYLLENGRLVHQGSIEIDESAIALSLDIAHGQTVVSTNTGKIALVRTEEEVEMWTGSLCEAWCASLDRHDPNVAYSGSDDYSWCSWDLRDTSHPTFKSKFHKAGVCAVASAPLQEHILATGSYDEILAVWDKRNLRSPLGTFKANSGVWRLKWHPETEGRLMAACMHDGFKIMDTACPESVKEVSCRPTASIAYGCDWIVADGKELHGGSTFYNHEAIIWSST